MQRAKTITFLSDYGLEDGFVGVCHGVMARIAPDARIIDLAHGLDPFNVLPAAVLLRNSLPFFERGVHIAVVDPGVGSERRALLLVCGEGHILVGPDNGLLLPAADALGGIELAVDIGSSPYRLERSSETFHGRDIFCPVAAHIAAGADIGNAGKPVEADGLVRLDLQPPLISDGRAIAQVTTCDRFGNISLNFGQEELEGSGFTPGCSLKVEHGKRGLTARYSLIFADVGIGEALIYIDSSRSVAVALNQANASKALGLDPAQPVKLSLL